MLYLDDDVLREMGVKLGQGFTEGELDSLGDLMRDAAEACDHYIAHGERAVQMIRTDDSAPVEFELMAPEDIEDALDGYRERRDLLRTFAKAIEAGEKLGREDH